MTSTSRFARAVAMLTTVLATMAGVLVMVGVTAAPAQAVFDTTQGSGSPTSPA